VIKLISFIVLTQFFHFNELKVLRQPGYFFKLNQQYFFYNAVYSTVQYFSRSPSVWPFIFSFFMFIHFRCLKKEQTTKKVSYRFLYSSPNHWAKFSLLANCCFVLKNNLRPCQWPTYYKERKQVRVRDRELIKLNKHEL